MAPRRPARSWLLFVLVLLALAALVASVVQAASTPDDDSDPFSDIAADLDLSDEAASTIPEPYVPLWKRIVNWVSANIHYLMAAGCTLLAFNMYALLFIMGYLLREEHVVVRAARLRRTPVSKVWRAIVDVQAYPAWRSAVTSVKRTSSVGELCESVGDSHDERAGSRFRTYVVTEAIKDSLLVRKTHPDYEPVKYAQPIVMKGAPVAANINESIIAAEKSGKNGENVKSDEGAEVVPSSSAKKNTELRKRKGKKGVAADVEEKNNETDEQKEAEPVTKRPTTRSSNVLELPVAPLFYPPGVPAQTETWTFELEPFNSEDGTEGTVLYISYQGTIRNRAWRFIRSIGGFDAPVEEFFGSLGALMGERLESVKPVQGQLNI